MKIGVMGGTFDPIHLGLLRAAELPRDALDLALVAFVPCGQPPHRVQPLSSDLDRFAMVCLAIQGHPHFMASDIELTREGPSYTVETIAAFKNQHPQAELFLIVGSDAFMEMETWRDLDRLVALCRVAVVGRPQAGHEMHKINAQPWASNVPGNGLPISATQVRQSLKAGQSVRYLVPEAVAEHIQRRGLYR